MTRLICTFVVAAALAACGKKQEEPAPAQGSATPTAVEDAAVGSAAGSGQGSAAEAEPLDVPTEVDFEDLASSEITDKNVEARVKAIEQELQQ